MRRTCAGTGSSPSSSVKWSAGRPCLRRRRGAATPASSRTASTSQQGARGLGIGRALLEALIAGAERAGIWTIQTSIFPENRASLALHERCGFRVVGTPRARCQDAMGSGATPCSSSDEARRSHDQGRSGGDPRARRDGDRRGRARDGTYRRDGDRGDRSRAPAGRHPRIPRPHLRVALPAEGAPHVHRRGRAG